MSVKWLTTGLYLAGILVSASANAATQTVFPNKPDFSVNPDETIKLDINYASSSPQNIAGIGLKLYFDSSKLTAPELSNILSQNIITHDISPDVANTDGDNATDKKINIAWVDINKKWPGTANGDTKLLTVQFEMASGFSSATRINFTGNASAGNRFSANSLSITPKPSTPDANAPSITAPDDKTIEARKKLTTVTTEDLGTPTVSDDKDPSPTVTFSPTEPLGLGEHTITWTVKDNANNQSTATQTITLVDTIPPTIQAPGDKTVTATGVETTVDIGFAKATDTVSGVLISSDAPSTFTVGTQTVTWTAKDSANNIATATQEITVSTGEGPSISAPADITVEATGETTAVELGTATASDATDGELSATADNTGPFTVGEHTITWTVKDSANNTATATQTVTVTDTTKPEITLNSSTLKINATAVNTPISDYGVSANDIVDGNISVEGYELIDGNEQALPVSGFVSGTHHLIWTATDNAKNTASIEQTIEITPLANFVASQSASAGDTVKVNVELSGKAVNYSVKVPYSIDTQASTVINDGADHNASNGEVVIASGTKGSFSFKVADNPALNGTGKGDLVFVMGSATNAVVGSSKTHKVTIFADNIAPVVNVAMKQSGTPVTVVIQDAGNVLVNATATDSTSQTLSYDWSGSNSALSNLSSKPEVFEFDPTSLSVGTYGTAVTVKDNGSPQKQTTVNTNFIVKAGSSSVADSDGDGIKDDKDNVAEPNRLPANEGGSDKYILQSEAGTKLKLGDVAQQQGQNAATVDMTGLPEISGEYKNTALEIYDFEITGVAQGASTLIILPQHKAIPIDAVYLKSNGNDWKPFKEDAKNAFYSAQQISKGVCPATGDSKYKAGLKQGDYCVQLKIEDGGANDTDGLVNGSVADPGVIVARADDGASTTPPVTTTPTTDLTGSGSSSGGGGSFGWFMMLLAGLGVLRKRSNKILKLGLFTVILGMSQLAFAGSVDDIPTGYFSSHADVCDSCSRNKTTTRYLQRVLNADEDLNLSPKLIVDGDWGGKTRGAVEKFQLKYSITTQNGAGYGRVGPITRSKLDFILDQLKNPNSPPTGTTNFLYNPLKGSMPPYQSYSHSDAPISSIYDHSSAYGTIISFDVQQARQSYGALGNCYKILSGQNIEFKGLCYKGSGGRSQYLCYDKSGGLQHKGWDYAVAKNTPVFAAADGKVSYANWENPNNQKQGFGKYVSIYHSGDFKTCYGHLNSINSSIYLGKNVKKGDLLGYSGNTGSSTGAHLHFEVRKNCVYIATGCSSIDPFTTNKSTDLWADWDFENTSGSKPLTPTGLNASDNRTDGIRLNWTPSTTSGIKYDIYRSTSSSESSMGLPVKSKYSGTSWNDRSSSIVAGTNYYYRIKACKESLCSDDFSDFARGKKKETNSTITKTTIKTKISDDNYGGLTIITHGLLSNADSWVKEMGEVVRKKIKGTTAIVKMTFEKLSNGYDLNVDYSDMAQGKQIENIIILVDWGSLSGVPFYDANNQFELQRFFDVEDDVAEWIVNQLVSDEVLKKYLTLPIHLIGHSRGGSVVSHIAGDLGEQGVFVDQLTLLDPHPMNRQTDLSSLAPSIFTNVIYSDTYFQKSNKLNALIPGYGFGDSGIIGYCIQSFSDCRDITKHILDAGEYRTQFAYHSGVHEYYFGTILDELGEKSSYPYYSSHLSSLWYSRDPKRDNTGFNKTRFAYNKGSNRKISGINNAFYKFFSEIPNLESIGKRDTVYLSNNKQSYYPNIIFKSNITGKIQESFTNGKIDVVHQFYFNPSVSKEFEIKLFLDSDNNPFNNNNNEKTLKTKILNTTSSYFDYKFHEFPIDFSFSIHKSDFSRVDNGKYRLGVSITNKSNGKVRYDYHMSELTISHETTPDIPTPINHTPDTPSVISPIFEASNVPLTPTIKFTSFSDSDSDSHAYTWFDIRKVNDNKYLYDSGWIDGTTTSTVPSGYLDYETRYKIRVRYKDDNGGRSSIGESKFTTLPAPKPKVTNLDVTQTNQNEVGISALINSYNVANTQVNFSWGTSASMAHNTPVEILSSSNEIYTQLLESLDCETTYYYQPVATNSKGIVKGEMKSFVTKPCSAQISFTASSGLAGVEDFGKVKLGSCETQTLTITKQNDMGIATGSIDLSSNVFVIKSNTNSFSLSNKQDKAEFDIEFCPTEKRDYNAIVIATSDADFSSNRDRVMLIGQGDNVVVPGDKSDLIAINPVPSTLTPKTGQSITLNIDVKNIGSASSSSTRTRYYLSNDSTITTSDTEVDDESTPDLDANEVKQEHRSFDAPANAGIYWLGACVDKVSNESNITNNCSEGVRIEVADSETAEHDFSIDNFVLSKTELKLNDRYDIDVTYHYEGNSTELLKPKATIYISKDNQIGASDKVYFEIFGGIELSKTKRDDVQHYKTRAYVDIPAGNYFLILKINDPEKYFENNVNNNTKSIPVTIMGSDGENKSDLTINGVGFAGGINLKIGQEVTPRGTVKNIGTVDSAQTKLRFYLSKDQTIEATDTELGFENVAILTAGQEQEYGKTLTIPDMALGNYWYGVCVDTFDNELDRNNNCMMGSQITVNAADKKSDLVILDVNINTTQFTQQDKLELNFKAKNIGTGDAQSSKNIFCYIGTASDKYASKVCGTSTQEALVSQAEESWAFKTIDLTAIPLGSNYLLTVVIDQDQTEPNKDNNETSSVPFNVVARNTFTLDIDGDGQVKPLTDGLLNLSYKFGFRGDELINGAVAPNATRKTADEIETYLIVGGLSLDIDGDGEIKPLTDGILTLRYLFDFRGDTLIDNAVGENATRKTPQMIENKIQSLIP